MLNPAKDFIELERTANEFGFHFEFQLNQNGKITVKLFISKDFNIQDPNLKDKIDNFKDLFKDQIGVK